MCIRDRNVSTGHGVPVRYASTAHPLSTCWFSTGHVQRAVSVPDMAYGAGRSIAYMIAPRQYRTLRM
eukprot:1857942-Rhodomonas_salina.1